MMHKVIFALLASSKDVSSSDRSLHTPAQGWARLIIAAYGPTLLASIGFGAVIPLIALQATALGASVGLAAAITGLTGIATLLFDLPAGVVAERLGEKRAIMLACLVDTALMVLIWTFPNLWVLAAVVFVHGMTLSIFGLARQKYLTESLPLKYRARGMSSLGGVFRIGFFLGPLVGAALVHDGDLGRAFLFAGVMSLVAAGVTALLPDLPSDKVIDVNKPRPHTLSVLRRHWRVLATVGIGCLGMMFIRSARQTIIPLWSQAHGLAPSQTSLIYSMSMAMDVLLFFPGGALMDRFGRWWVCVPSAFVMSIGLLVLPLTHDAWTITAVACLLGLGNGVSSGIVMTLGADSSPRIGRTQFLAGWRLLSDSGNALGPLVISAVTAIVSLGWAAVVVGVLGLGFGAWLSHWVPRRPEDIVNLTPAEDRVS